MKALKNLFAVVIAVAAIGVTIASHAGAFTAKKSVAVDCYTKALKDGLPTSTAVDLIIGSPACNVAQAQIGKTADFTSPGTQVIDPVQCPGTLNFCCAQKDAANRITAVFCRNL